MTDFVSLDKEDRKYTTDFVRLDQCSKEERTLKLREAAALIRSGELVAFPTETVYGLGADGMNASASERIYAAKGRPSDNPLIMHIARFEDVDVLADMESMEAEIAGEARKLMEAFWPGPLTIILPKRKEVPDETTGGLNTVAIRMPSHPVARELIAQSGRMIAAPSANTSGKPSPTLGEHVYEDMQGRIPMVLDGGAVGIGIESTIVDMTGNMAMILRPGFITEEMIRDVIGRVETDPAMKATVRPEHVVAKAPGMKYRHYAPKGQLFLVEGEPEAVAAEINRLSNEKKKGGYRVAVLCTDESAANYPKEERILLGSRLKPETIAASLYRSLRDCDDRCVDYIYSESFFTEGIGDAIMNRMLKAAGYQLIHTKE